jgi:methyl-accepting chemotaxis protein
MSRFGLATRLWIVDVFIVSAAIGGTLYFQNPLWSAATAVTAVLLLRVTLVRTFRPLEDLRDRMMNILVRTSEEETQIKVQNSLDTNINLLRNILYGHGDPRQVGDELYFGSKLINGVFDDVDRVKVVAGGVATIFCRNLRIATNILQPDGARAIGTKLAQGPAYDCLFKQTKTYRGEAEIFGQAYLTVYEPIIERNAVIGVLFVGVPKANCPHSHLADETRGGDVIGDMANAVHMFEEAAGAKAQAEREAADQRHLAEDVRRQHEAAGKAAAAAQREVVGQLSVGLERLSSGDLTHHIETAFPADYEKLRQDFNDALDRLRATMSSIMQDARSMRQGTSEISRASDDLAHRTARTAASIEETAAALDEITAKVNKTAEGAQQASRIVSNARSNAERSGVIVSQAVTAMAEIDKSAQEISQIISVIDEIAFQTNLLALNAGVEAARAGDTGRGFAVVASEVRALAQRSADAAKQIKALILASADQVNRGVDLVAQTGEALVGIVQQVADINNVVGEIAASAREQASSLQQVNNAVNEMDQVTQQNASMVEESTSASQALAHESEHLAEMVGHFDVGASAQNEVKPAKSASSHPRLGGAAPRPHIALATRGALAHKLAPKAAADDWEEF